MGIANYKLGIAALTYHKKSKSANNLFATVALLANANYFNPNLARTNMRTCVIALTASRASSTVADRPG